MKCCAWPLLIWEGADWFGWGGFICNLSPRSLVWFNAQIKIFQKEISNNLWQDLGCNRRARTKLFFLWTKQIHLICSLFQWIQYEMLLWFCIFCPSSPLRRFWHFPCKNAQTTWHCFLIFGNRFFYFHFSLWIFLWCDLKCLFCLYEISAKLLFVF